MAAGGAARAPELHTATPLTYSQPLSDALGGGAEVFLKMDCLQPPGSFKVRGIGRTIALAQQRGVSHIVSSSGGNAGLAAAYSARQLGMACTVVLPSTTPQLIIRRLQAQGADVVVRGDVWDAANVAAMDLVVRLGDEAVLVHPFDDPDTWDGHATAVAEMSEQLGGRAPDAIVTCVGGGGLLMGILRGLDAVGWSAVPVVACETVGADSMAQALAAGELVTLPGIASVAKSLGATRVSEAVFSECKARAAEGLVRPWVTGDREAVEAVARFADDHRVLVEPACGAALAAVYQRSPALSGCRTVVVEVCGGAAVTRALLDGWCEQLGVPRPSDSE